MKALEILLMDRHDIANYKIVTTEMFNEAIIELESIQSRGCEGCKNSFEFKRNFYECRILEYADQEGCSSYIEVDKNFCCNRYKAKEQ